MTTQILNPLVPRKGNLIDNGDLYIKTDDMGIGYFNDSAIAGVVPKWKTNKKNLLPIAIEDSFFSSSTGLDYVKMPITPWSVTGETYKEVVVLCSSAANFQQPMSLTFETEIGACLDPITYSFGINPKLKITGYMQGFFSAEDLKKKNFTPNKLDRKLFDLEIQPYYRNSFEETETLAWESRKRITQKVVFGNSLITPENLQQDQKYFWLLRLVINWENITNIDTSHYFNQHLSNLVYKNNFVLIGKTKLYSAEYTTNLAEEKAKWNNGFEYTVSPGFFTEFLEKGEMAFPFNPNYTSLFDDPIQHYGILFGDGKGSKRANKMLKYKQGQDVLETADVNSLHVDGIPGAVSTRRNTVIEIKNDTLTSSFWTLPSFTCDYHTFPWLDGAETDGSIKSWELPEK